MKRLLLVGLVTVLLLVVAAPPMAVAVGVGPAPKATGEVWSEVLSGDLMGIRTLVFNAQGTLEEAKGTVSFSLSWPPSSFYRSFEGYVTGYWQSGNRAALRGVITNQTGYLEPLPTHFAVRVEDNGQGSKAAGPDRFMAFYGWAEASDQFLTDWDVDWPFDTYSVPVTSENLVVH